MNNTNAKLTGLLEKANHNPINAHLIQHGRSVGEAAGRIAKALNEAGQNLDVERIIILGRIHDIGKLDGFYNFIGHLLKGYADLKREHYPDEYCNICLTHSFIKNDANFTLSGSVFDPKFLPSKEFMDSLSDVIPESDKCQFLTNFIAQHEFTLEEKIISLCDLMCFFDILTLEQRMINIISRHGTYQNTQNFVNEALALKAEIDQMLGYNLYGLFPELKTALM